MADVSGTGRDDEAVRRFIERFALVDDAACDDIRAMLATIEAAGWTSLTQTAVDH